MSNLRLPLSFSPISLASGAVGVLSVAYIGLIAMVMSYAALTVEFSQSVKNDEAAVSVMESQYLAGVVSITNKDYVAAGYTMPTAKIFVPVKSATALR